MSRAARRVYYDGGCPVCRREIAWYRSRRGGEGVDWVDLTNTVLPPGLDRAAMMKRFTVERADGAVVSGAAGFVALWRALPATGVLGRIVDNHIAIWILERAYRGFLGIRGMWRSAP